jgi:hypothetical protein
MIHTTGFNSDLIPQLEDYVKTELGAKKIKLRSTSNHCFNFNADGVKGEIWLNCLSNDDEIRANDITYDVEISLS